LRWEIYKSIEIIVIKEVKRNWHTHRGALLNVIKILRSHEQEIKGRFAVRRMGLFGSFVRGEETKESDIVILVEF